MMLQRLKEYAERIEAVQPAGYSKRRIRWELALDNNGTLLDAIDLAQNSTGHKAAGQELSAPNVVRSSGDCAFLLADKAEYALGRPSRSAEQRRDGILFDGKSARRVVNRHRLFRELVDDCAAETRDPAVQAVQQFLNGLPPFEPSKELRDLNQSVHLPDEFEFGDQVTFSVLGKRPIESPSVKAYWAARTEAA